MKPKDTSADEAAIIEIHRRFAEAWSRGDVDALMAMFAEDAVRVGVRGDTQRGRQAIRESFEQLFSGPFAGASVTLERGSVRLLSGDSALWQGRIEIETSGEGPGLEGYALDVMTKVGSTWMILETHPKLFPPPR